MLGMGSFYLRAGDNYFCLKMKKESSIIEIVTIFFLLFFIVEPDGVAGAAMHLGGSWNMVHEFFRITKYVTFLAVVPMLLIIGKPSKMLWLIIIYNTLIVVSCYFNRNLEWDFVFLLLKITAISILVEYFVVRKNPLIFLKAFFLFLFLYIIINFYTLIHYYPDGMYIDNRNWGYNFILGYKNRHIYFFLPCLLSLAILQYINYRKLNFSYYVVLSVVFLSCILNSSTTSLVVVFLFAFLLVFGHRIIMPKWITPATLFVFMAAISFFFIMGTISGDFAEYTEFIKDNSGKDVDTLASRGFIWAAAIVAVAEHPFLGNGNFSYYESKYVEYYQMHNNFLDVLTLGGGILFFVFFLQFYVLSKNLNKIRNTWIYTVFVLIFFAYFIEFITEGKRDNIILYPILIIAYHSPLLIKKIDILKRVNKIN